MQAMVMVPSREATQACMNSPWLLFGGTIKTGNCCSSENRPPQSVKSEVREKLCDGRALWLHLVVEELSSVDFVSAL